MIQPVGGSKVYVITGSGRDPRRTSTGQSWANLASSQKYKLWQEAQKQALQEIQYDQMSHREKIQIQEALKSQLYGEIEDIKRATRKMQDAEIKSRQAIQEGIVREANRRGRSSTISGGSTRTTSHLVNPIDKQLSLDVDRAERQFREAQKFNMKIEGDAADLDLMNPAAARKLRQQKSDLSPFKKSRDALRAVQEERSVMSKEEKDVELETLTRTGGSSRTKERPIVSAEPISYEAELAALEEERTALETQLQGIEAPTLERPDLLGKTREVYQGLAPRRKLALDFLQPPQEAVQQVQPAIEQAPIEPVFQSQPIERAEEAPSVQLSPEPDRNGKPRATVGIPPSQYVAAEYTRQIKGLSQTGKAQKAMELIRDLGKAYDPATEKYQEARKAIIDAYQKSVNPKASAAIKKGKAAKDDAIPDTKEAKLVHKLYNPSSDMDDKKRQELFDNAAAEIKSYYKDDPEALQLAMETLVQLHEKEK